MKKFTLLLTLLAMGGITAAAADYTVTVPAGATFTLATKAGGKHYVDFAAVQPASTETVGDNTVIKYTGLSNTTQYNYRTSMPGKLTLAGLMYITADATAQPLQVLTAADYEAFAPSAANHDVSSNKGFETGDILLNINPAGHLQLNAGDTYTLHAMRSWELTNSIISNYFIEPDFRYTVTDTQGNPSDAVVTINAKAGSAWATLHAVGTGTAIVTVTYDAISLAQYDRNGKKSEFNGGNDWGAIWPENTGVFVVTVGQTPSAVKPEMVINEEYNKENLKLAGKYVDAEHDSFYFLDTEEGALYTFTPEGAATVAIAAPVIGENVTYTGFTADGVTANTDGSYTLLLKEGRNIVRLTDASGNAAYQVLTARPCHREIINKTETGRAYFKPGDKVTVQYSGLRHPANKLAGIYNMSAFVTYNDTPNGTSIVGGKNQYTFASAATAQAFTLTVPDDVNPAATPEYVLGRGVVQLGGYGDPIGNHRNIDPEKGRLPNFSAQAHKTYFGQLPDVRLPLTDPAAVSDIEADSTAVPVAYYNLQGQPSQRPWQGLNLVRYADGSVRKLMY